MAYTPELNQRYSAILRRIAWALGVPMTKAIERVFDEAVKLIDGKRVCTWCRDKGFCSECPFHHGNHLEPSPNKKELDDVERTV